MQHRYMYHQEPMQGSKFRCKCVTNFLRAEFTHAWVLWFHLRQFKEWGWDYTYIYILCIYIYYIYRSLKLGNRISSPQNSPQKVQTVSVVFVASFQLPFNPSPGGTLCTPNSCSFSGATPETTSRQIYGVCKHVFMYPTCSYSTGDI